jgi:hypothetical protein
VPGVALGEALTRSELEVPNPRLGPVLSAGGNVRAAFRLRMKRFKVETNECLVRGQLVEYCQFSPGTLPAMIHVAGGASGDPPLRPGRRLPNLFNGPARSPRAGLLPYLGFEIARSVLSRVSVAPTLTAKSASSAASLTRNR